MKINKYDLLRPLSRFYNLLNITGILIIWTLVVFIIAFLYTYSTSVDKLSIIGVIAIVIITPIFASPLIILCIHMLYRSYMNTIKKVFSKAYYPDKYMKVDEDLNNSIHCAVPVKPKHKAMVKNQEEDKYHKDGEDKSESLKYEGGENEENKNFDNSKDVTDKHILPPLIKDTQKAFNPDLGDNIYQQPAEKVYQLKKSKATLNGPPSDEEDDADCSVYEVDSDDKDDIIAANIGLMESESRSGENIKTMAVFIILFAVLIFSAAICCHIAFYLSSAVAGWCILLLIIIAVLDILIFRNLCCIVIALIIWCRKRKQEKKLQKYLEIVIQKYCSEKWDANAPMGGFQFKDRKKVERLKDLESDERFNDGDRDSARDDRFETGKALAQIHQDDDSEHKTQDDAETRRQALLAKMRSTHGSNGFTETTSKARRRKRMLKDPDGVFGADMGDMDRPSFQRQLNKDEIDKLLKENPELADEFDNERQRWLEFGEEDPNNINPLSDYNTLLVAKMQKGYDNKADGLIESFRKKDFKAKLNKAEEERQNELKELEMDKLEMQGQAVAFSNSAGVVVRKKIKRKKKGKKKGKMFILDTPYGQAKYYKRRNSPPPVSDRGVMFQNRKNLDKLTRTKAKKIHGEDKEGSFRDRSGSSIVENDEVMFDTGFGPNKLIETDDDEFDEGDMVFYNKDDMTNFSKNLGLNKLQSRLSLINFGQEQTRKSISVYPLDEIEDEEAQYEDEPNNSPGPKRKLIQKNRKKKKKKSKSINSFRMNKTISVRDAISSLNSDEYGDEYSSEEDNPNDRSGLLSGVEIRGRKGVYNTDKKPKKGRISQKNQWLGVNKKEKEIDSLGRKSFRSTSNLSLILPRYKNKMKRTRMIRKKKAPEKIVTSNGSPYEEYLPARFKDYKHEDLNSSKLSQNMNKRDIKRKDLPSAYVLSPSVGLNSALPPLSKQSKQRGFNFYGSNKSVGLHPKGTTVQSATSLGLKPGIARRVDIDELEEDSRENDYDDESGDHNFVDMNHDNVMFQRNHQVKPHKEDKAQNPTSALLFPMNKDFHQHDAKLISVDSRDGSRQGSRAGSRGRTYTTDKGIISLVPLK